MDAIVSLRDVSKDFGTVRALDSVGFDIEKGDIFGIFGPNGAGKTTLIRIMVGEIPPTSGKVSMLGLNPWKKAVEVKSRVGIVPEVESPPSYLTADEYMDFVLAVRDINDESVKDRWLSYFDLDEWRTTLCKDLSKGMRQKLMLASAFVHDPPLLLLDEPFINLDPVYQKKLREFLLQRKKEGKTTFVCTHILEIAQKLCSSVLILDRGKVVAKGNMEEILTEGDGKLEDLFMRVIGRNP